MTIPLVTGSDHVTIANHAADRGEVFQLVGALLRWLAAGPRAAGADADNEDPARGSAQVRLSRDGDRVVVQVKAPGDGWNGVTIDIEAATALHSDLAGLLEATALPRAADGVGAGLTLSTSDSSLA